MSHAASSKICKYDVFLSFRGEDTRRTFVSRLYNALEQRGIHTFKDDERLVTGKSISTELLKAIEDARFAIVILSKSYASSKWCLEEPTHIINCKNELEQIVIPVFYDVSPSDVCHQNPPFAESFFQHENCKDDMEKVHRWRDAFAEAGKISGYHLQNFNENVHNEENPRRSTRQRTSTSFGSDFVTFLLEDEPRTFKEAMSSSDSSFWKEAVNSEIDSILSNHTWELVDLPSGNKPLVSKWIFKRKMKTDGTIDKYKARLVVKGFNQKEGLDYFDTYSPVTRITSVRMLIALAAVYDLQIHQIDVKTAFLNGELEEEIYMEQPEGFVVPGKENKVCKLVKSLYGLKQAPKQWHAKFDQTMLANGFKINECDKCVYIKDTPNHQVIVCLYVDDMLIISRDICDINATKRMLESKFDMKDLGVADVILGIIIHQTPQGLALSQSHYIEKILDKFKYMEFDIAKTPLDANFALRKNKGESDSQLEYDIPYWPKPVAPVCIHCDSQATIGRAGSMMYNGKSCHIRRKHNTVRELLSSGIITIDYVKSKDNVSDPLTKGLSREGVERTSKGMGLRPRTSQHGGGIGKTEIASVLYQRYRQRFQADCFLGDVGALHQKNGLTWLAQVVICMLFGEKITLTSEHEGVIILKNRLRWKKVLFILDDVNHREQLEYLVGGREWFGMGSRIILTARDKHLLISHVGDNVYEVQLLPEDEAFREKSPKKDFMVLSRQVVEYAGGLPLALKVLGSSLRGRNKEQWAAVFDRLKKIPHDDILGKLKIGLDGLKEDEMRMFLDIACLYNRRPRHDVEWIFKSCGIHLIGINRLIEKSLLSTRDASSFYMHNLIREMGENVSRERQYANSRIWLNEEVHDLFAGKLKTKKVESLRIPKGYRFEEDHVNHSKKLSNLKHLDLRESLGLTKTPNFGDMSNLETLDLRGCSNLEEVHPSLGYFKMLTSLILFDCVKLEKLPKFVTMESLKSFDLLRCTGLKEFPEICGDIGRLLGLTVGSPG
ncbi:TMV resistance protein N [Capsicum baccatum]|uniref:TMV resistance protein N n=1 Tax=Capsicum baccatum TaxID=33114 RepID=A0A2G2VHR0_CAPBA|nr:TMV resistance protein N [Capsicum baccatum]